MSTTKTTTATTTNTIPIELDSTVAAIITYSLPPADGTRAFNKTYIDPKTGIQENNISIEKHSALVENIRGKEDRYILDSAGFQFFKSPTKVTNFDDEKAIEEKYYPESTELIKELTGASRVVIFDHTHRISRSGELESSSGRKPASVVHVDQSSQASVNRVHRHIPAEEVPELLKHRFQIINLWRPIGNPALDWPLALCDYRSVNPEKDIYPIAVIYPDHEGETLGVKYNSKHQWKYLSGMTPDEFVLIKCADSMQDGSVAVFTPHTAFEDPSTPKNAPPRQSIELRALVFYD